MFVTNALNFLPHTTSISVISDGEIKTTGSYDNLISSNELFKDFVKKFLERKEHDDKGIFLNLNIFYFSKIIFRGKRDRHTTQKVKIYYNHRTSLKFNF